jgi:hypothetical protein
MAILQLVRIASGAQFNGLPDGGMSKAQLRS